MCRAIKTLHNFTPPATDEEIRASSLQFVRKLSGFTRPSKANEPAFNAAVEQVTQFVTTFNELTDKIAELTKFDADTKTAGLLLGDATGAVAAVELAHRALAAEEPGDTGYVARSNHYVSDRLRGEDLAPLDDIGTRTSRARIATLDHALRALPLPFALDAVKSLMARHGDSASAALCRHEEGRAIQTISCAIFDCKSPALHFAFDAPCRGRWLRIEP